MIKKSLIIADDEPLARETLARQISENFPDFTIAGTAYSGPSSVSLFEKEKPSVVIIDIRMPGFDGLEASRQILSKIPETQIIILSAYDDFYYARQAIHQGIIGYLLKPVKIEELGELLKKAESNLLRIQENSYGSANLRTLRTIAKKEQVASFIYGGRFGISASEFAYLSDPPVENGYFIVFKMSGNIQINSTLIEKTNSRLEKISIVSPGDWMGNYLPVFVSVNYNTEAKWKNESVFVVNEILHIFKETVPDAEIQVGIGPVYSGAENFPDSFHKAFDALYGSSGSEKINFPENRINSNSGFTKSVYPEKIEKELLSALHGGNIQKVYNKAEEFSDFIINQGFSLIDSKFAVIEFLIILKRENYIGTKKTDGRKFENLSREVLLCSEHIILKQWFILFIHDYLDSINAVNGNEYILLRKIKHFVNLNNLKNVSLESAADSAGISSSYLSRLFKEKTGENFHDYVTRCRLETAIKLLRETAQPVQEISYSVGYSDVGYFSRLFRKKFGSTPSEYRKNIR